MVEWYYCSTDVFKLSREMSLCNFTLRMGARTECVDVNKQCNFDTVHGSL